jgi:hypothetical protein
MKQRPRQRKLPEPLDSQRGCGPHRYQQLGLWDAIAERSSPTVETNSSIPSPISSVVVSKKPRRTYSQHWTTYNAAQINEVAEVQRILNALCGWIPATTQDFGRPAAQMRDVIFCLTVKVLSGMSGRRAMHYLRDAKADGYIQGVLHYNTLSKYLLTQDFTPHLLTLIRESARPLRQFARVFAVDSSGFAVCNSQRWGDVKWDHARIMHGDKVPNSIKRKDWVKLHIASDVVSNIITAAHVTDAYGSDHNYFKPLLDETAKDFIINKVVADKAYSSRHNLALVVAKAAMPYIPFRSNTRPSKSSPSVWKRMYRLSVEEPERFESEYHVRSNVETTFSMIKRKFGERVRSKKWPATANEVLLKVLCHNLCCLVQAKYELGIDVMPGVS